jgi:hypothetical protein
VVAEDVGSGICCAQRIGKRHMTRSPSLPPPVACSVRRRG